MEKEIWKDIVGYEGLYQISNKNNIKSLKYGKERILKPDKGLNGYLKVHLYKNGKSHAKLLHRLKAVAFIPNPDNFPVVMHLDNDKLNLNLNNLKWGTPKENNYQIIKEGRNNFTNGKHPDLGKLRGKSKGARKVNQYTKDGIFIKTWDCIKDGAESVNIKYNNICRSCKTGQIAGGFKWSYFI